MFLIYRLPHWRYLSENKKLRSQALCKAVKRFERTSNVLYCTISYTKNGSYIMAGQGDLIFGMDAYDRNRRLPSIALTSDDTKMKNVTRRVSMQEAVYKSIRFNEIEISEAENSIKLSKVGKFSFVDFEDDKLTVFHSADLDFDCKVIKL